MQPNKTELSVEDLEMLISMFDVREDQCNEVYNWMILNFADYDSIELVDEAIDQFLNESDYEDVDPSFFDELVEILYSEGIS